MYAYQSSGVFGEGGPDPEKLYAELVRCEDEQGDKLANWLHEAMEEWQEWFNETRVEPTARAAREAGQYVEINHGLSYVVVHRGEDDEYFFQGEEADNLLEEVPEWANEEEWILWSAQGW